MYHELRKQGIRPVPAMSQFVASASRAEVSWILPCAAAFCLMSKLALPRKRDAGEKTHWRRRRAGEEAR
jgi:hypothetical protein